MGKESKVSEKRERRRVPGRRVEDNHTTHYHCM